MHLHLRKMSARDHKSWPKWDQMRLHSLRPLIINIYNRGVQHVPHVPNVVSIYEMPNVAHDSIGSGTRALAIFHTHATMPYRYIVYCCSIVLIKLVFGFHSFCSSILIQDVGVVKLRYLLDQEWENFSHEGLHWKKL